MLREFIEVSRLSRNSCSTLDRGSIIVMIVQTDDLIISFYRIRTERCAFYKAEMFAFTTLSVEQSVLSNLQV